MITTTPNVADLVDTNTEQSAAAVTFTPTVASTNATPDQLYSKLEIELKGNDPAVLKSYSFFATTAAQHLNIEVGKR